MDTRYVDYAFRDARYGLRLLKRSPIFTVVAILSLALGIGANAAIFHLIDTIQLRSLAIARPQELAEVRPDGPQAFGTLRRRQRESDRAAVGADSREPERVLDAVRVGRHRLRRRARRGIATGARLVGQRRLLRRARHRSREWAPARTRRRSQLDATRRR